MYGEEFFNYIGELVCLENLRKFLFELGLKKSGWRW